MDSARPPFLEKSSSVGRPPGGVITVPDRSFATLSVSQQSRDRQWGPDEAAACHNVGAVNTSVACVAIGFATPSAFYLVIRRRSYVAMGPIPAAGTDRFACLMEE